MGANVSSVAMMQLVRSIGSLIFFPILIGFMLKKIGVSEVIETPKYQEFPHKILRVFFTLVIGTAGGFFGYLFHQFQPLKWYFH